MKKPAVLRSLVSFPLCFALRREAIPCILGVSLKTHAQQLLFREEKG